MSQAQRKVTARSLPDCLVEGAAPARQARDSGVGNLARQSPVARQHSTPDRLHGSPALRSFGRAWLAVGLVGSGVLFVLYVITDNARVDVAVPLLVVFMMLGATWMWQGRRRR